ncbi:MAG TPA: hypothetical protein VFZ48_03045 [Candidatus Saccharimonadales bacterium]
MGLFSKKPARESESRRNPSLMKGQDDYTFRRSRTLTGSVSPEVKSASEQKARLKSPRLKEHELRAQRRKLFMGAVALLCAAGLIYWLLTQFTARISAIIYTPAPLQSPDTPHYTEAIQSYLRGRPLERFSFSLDEGRLTAYVQQKMPEVEQVRLNSDGALGSDTFTIKLRMPEVGWRVKDTQYYVDGNGASFKVNYFKPPAVTIKDESGVSPSGTSALASQRFLGFVGRVVALTNASGIGTVKQVVIPPGTARSVEIGLKGKGTVIKMHIDRDPASQVEDARLSMKHFRAHNLKPKYVDVRVAGKAYFR